MGSVHESVLLKETVSGLALPEDANSIVVDGTLGGGGHTQALLKNYPRARVIAFDQDLGAWLKARTKLEAFIDRIEFQNKNFRVVGELGGEVDGVILDLGISSDQLETSGRGFSFVRNEPLIMTMKENPSPDDVTAYDVVNNWSEESLANIIYGFGEEKFAKRIARAIVYARSQKKIETTFELVDLIKNAVPFGYRRGKIHFATKTFQAIRIAVNDELGALNEGLEGGFKILKVGGRMAVITFHSLEDRIVKNFNKNKAKEGVAKIINTKPITASKNELLNNKRSRSAKLRIIEKK